VGGDQGGGGMKLELPSLYIESVEVAPELWALTLHYVFLIDSKVFIIPVDFICDKYSIPKWPKWLRWLFPQRRSNAVENIPAWIHDYLVRFRNTLGLSLTDCHNIFLQAMSLVNLDNTTRKFKYTGVMLFNWMIVQDGYGTPPKDVKRFIDENGWGC